MRISDWSSDVCSSDLAALRLGAPVIELHTGRYADIDGAARADELRRLSDAAALAAKNGIEVHAGHGLPYDNVAPLAAIRQVRELNIGHFLIGEAIFVVLRSEEHTSELQSLMRLSSAVFFLK